MEYGLVVLWWVTYVGLGILGLPIAARLFSSLPGRGAGFSLTVSFAIVAIVAFWVGFLSLGWVALLAGLLALAVCTVLAARDGVDIDRRAAAEALVVFTLVYCVVLTFRAVDPGITPHGEKFLDFGLMASLYRAPKLPPEDFWFAGKPLIYYYGGQFLASLLTRLTGTTPWYGFNLAMAGFYSSLAAGAYELAGSIAVGERVRERFSTDESEGTGHTKQLAGVTAVFFTIFAANPSTAIRLVVRHLPGALGEAAIGAFAGAQSQLTTAVVAAPIPVDYHFKVASRIIPLTYDPFPFFAIVRGDLRPYLLSTPFLVCVAGLCYAYYRTPETARWRRRGLVFGALPVIAGFMTIVNTWSIAVVAGVVWLTLTFAPASLRSLLPPGTESDVSGVVGARGSDSPVGALARTAGALGVAAAATVLAALVALPFVFGPVSSGPSTPVTTLTAAERSPLGSLLLVHGAFLAVFVAYYLGRVRERWTDGIALAALIWFVALVGLVPRSFAPIVLFAAPLAVGWYLLATDRVGFEGVLTLAGFGLVLLAEVVYVQEGGDVRFNTVVKTYTPAWILWSSAAGVVLPRLVRGRGEWSWTRRRQQIGAVLAVLLVVSTAVYGGFATRSHFLGASADNTTLDGMTAADQQIPGQVAAIRWLDDRPGAPNIVSAPAVYVYRWSASPASSLTGVPTVDGVSHEAQFRGQAAFFGRGRAVNTIYLGSSAQRTELLERFDVRYIYVGPTELGRYGVIRPFSELPGIHVAFRRDNVTIYGVNQTRLDTST